MLAQGTTWLLVADGRRARVLVEERRGALLREETAMQIGADELYDPQDRAPRSYESTGSARHAMDGGVSLHEKEEENFLKRVAQYVGAAAKQNAFAHLVVIAPPRALGLLRTMLSAEAKARIRAEDAHDVLEEEAPRLRERLVQLLR